MIPKHSTFSVVVDFILRNLTLNDHIGMYAQKTEIHDKEAFRDLIKQIHHTTKEKGAYYDVLGEIFMKNIPKSSSQVFTPPHIAELMTEIVNCQNDKVMTDYACGSGRLLLAGAKSNPNAYLVGCDLDLLCAKMTAINLAINSLRGEVIWGNAQTKEVFAVFKVHKNLMEIPYIDIDNKTNYI